MPLRNRILHIVPLRGATAGFTLIWRCLPLVLAAAVPAAASAQDGATVYATYCAACHDDPTDEAIPALDALRVIDANTIVDTLTSGVMRLQGQPLSAEQQVQVAEYLAGAPVTEWKSFSVRYRNVKRPSARSSARLRCAPLTCTGHTTRTPSAKRLRS